MAITWYQIINQDYGPLAIFTKSHLVSSLIIYLKGNHSLNR